MGLGLLRAVTAALGLGLGASALAATNDLQLYRLGNPSDADAQARFRMLGNELGIALSGTTLQPANTLGMSGFDLGLEYDFVFVNGGNQIGSQPYWVTEGAAPNLLMVPTVHLRKGLPFSFDVGVKLAAVVNSATFAATLEVKWALLEGFKNLPDFSTRFYIGRAFGQQDLNLTTGGLDFSLGKQFGVAGLFALAPYGGFCVQGAQSSTSTFWSDPVTTTSQSYLANPTADVVAFAQNDLIDNLYGRIYGGVQLTSSIVSIAVEYGYILPLSSGIPVTSALQSASGKLGLTF
jgi:hypothetical protein